MSEKGLRIVLAVCAALALGVVGHGVLYVSTAYAEDLALESTPQPPEQYPGQHDHARPPEDYFCSNHPLAPPSHKCDCHRTCAKPKDEEGNEIDGPLQPQEDPKCSVWCHQDKCACPTSCDSTH